ncbi:MAG: glycerol-3-phosphate dehydrogenase/oxidase [Candidatus Melainabacteria bacterium]|nr:glycerol-3-phosphate dehydrogenase/oxidase [Candidatus Melainabacteria bacterium]
MKVSLFGTPVKPSLLVSRKVQGVSALNQGEQSELQPFESKVSNVQAFNKTPTLNFPMIERFTENQLNKEFDLGILGGGTNACGMARDASERGLKVFLLEKVDFAYGASFANSRLRHGGLRYTEHFEFGLVRESLTERELSLKNENHLVKPLEFCLPIYRGDKRGYLLIKIGMIGYDLLSYDKSLPCHRMLSRADVIDYEPSLNQDRLVGAAIFYDAQVAFTERVCVENALMAKQHGAVILNHAEVVGINLEGNKISSIEFVDHLSNKRHKINAKMFVNASGAWIDKLCGLTGKNLKRIIGATKGSHIVVRQFDGGPKRALIIAAKSDGRPFFIIPWQDYYLIGTTDIPYEGDLDNVKITEDEINYLLKESNRVLKNKQLSKKDILYSYSGVRPLPYVSQADPGKVSRKAIFRDHTDDGIENLLSASGKLTTYRHLSEQVVDFVFDKLGYKFIPTTTKTVPLMGAVDGDIGAFKKREIKKCSKKYPLEPEVVSHLIDLYGKNYKEVIELTLKNNQLGYLLSSHGLDIRAQVGHALKKESAYTISDVLLRRLSLGLTEGLGEDAIDYVASELKSFYGYTDVQIQAQKDDYYNNIIKLRKVT